MFYTFILKLIKVFIAAIISVDTDPYVKPPSVNVVTHVWYPRKQADEIIFKAKINELSKATLLLVVSVCTLGLGLNCISTVWQGGLKV